MWGSWGIDFKAEDLGCIPFTVKISPAMIETKVESKQVTPNNGSIVHVITNKWAQFDRESYFPVMLWKVIFDNWKEFPAQLSQDKTI